MFLFQKCSDIAKHSMFIGHPKRRRQIGGFDSLDICYYCCEDNFCNKYDCVKGMTILIFCKLSLKFNDIEM